MQIIVSDSSSLIDLRKADLLEAFLMLPFEFLIPNTLFEEELLKFTPTQKRTLLRGGLQVVDLPGEGVLRAQEVARNLPQLSIHDGFAFALAENTPGCILLTGDGTLRAYASRHKIEVHGVLWLIDEMHRNKVIPATVIRDALCVFAADPTVRLPARKLAVYIRRYEGLV